MPLHAGGPGPEARLAKLGTCAGGAACFLQNGKARCPATNDLCELNAFDTFTGQLVIEVDDRSCSTGQAGARIDVTLYATGPRGSGNLGTLSASLNRCGTSIRCSSSNPFLCDTLEDFASEDSLPDTAWLFRSTFPPTIENALSSSLGPGRPVIVRADPVAQERHPGDDDASSVVRFCVKGYMLRPKQ